MLTELYQVPIIERSHIIGAQVALVAYVVAILVFSKMCLGNPSPSQQWERNQS